MIRPLRGQVWIARLDPTEGREQAKTRPCLVLSNNTFNCNSGLAVIIPITSKNNGFNLHTRIMPSSGGLAMESFSMPEQIRTISITRFIKFVGTVHGYVQLDIEEKTKFLLDFE